MRGPVDQRKCAGMMAIKARRHITKDRYIGIVEAVGSNPTRSTSLEA